MGGIIWVIPWGGFPLGCNGNFWGGPRVWGGPEKTFFFPGFGGV